MALARHRAGKPLPDPLTEFCEWAREPTDLDDGKSPLERFLTGLNHDGIPVAAVF